MTEDLKIYARQVAGADLCGVADPGRFAGAPPGAP